MTASDVAVVVPSFGRPEQLSGCLDALARQEGGPYRTIVVDDGSPVPLAEGFSGLPPWVRIIRQENAGPATARNRGARASDAAFLCFTDDDCRPHPGWVGALRSAQGGDRSRLIGGRIENACQGNPFSAASQDLADWIRTYQERRTGEPDYFLSANLGCARSGFEAVGGFDEGFPLAAGEDRHFGLKWKGAVGPLVYAPGAVVDHGHHLTLGRFWRQQRNYGRGARRLHRLARGGVGGGGFEAPAFYAGLVLHPLSDRRLPLRRRVGRAMLLGLSQAAMVAGYLADRPGARGDDAEGLRQ
jgi:GT2 family glycosyltransferase